MSADGQTTTASTAQTLQETLIDSVDVKIEAYLGAAVHTLSELGALAADAVIVLDANINTPVELRVNGLAIASGELVAVGDRFGVRITALCR
ncbi:MAG: FliM/FliN family flagellar motor switch protein [Terricaulis sp.]